MRRKLLFTIALGAALAIIAAGTATSVTVEVNTTTDEVLPACSNLADDDGDGLVDMADPGCSGPLGTSEYNAPPSSGDSGGSGTTTTSPGTTTSAGTTTSPGTTTQKSPASEKQGASTGQKGIFGKQRKKGKGTKEIAKGERKKIEQPPLRNPDGSPARTNPGLTIAPFGPAPIGVPNPVIDSFEIPPFLLPIYQSCGTEYGIPWQVLASINKIETAFGTNLNVSSAGATGWMQFIPSTWEAYGVDANEDGRRDPYNPLDAICAAARYLRAAGGAEDLRTAIFAYNHADWYVDEVLLYANQYGKLPDALVGSLTGLTEGAHFPVAADARYAGDIDDAEALARSATPRAAPGNAADVISGNAARRSINIYAAPGSPVVAVNDSVVRKLGNSPKLGRYVVIEDVYGNTYTYAKLGEISKLHPVARERPLTPADFKLTTPGKGDRAPAAPASAGENSRRSEKAAVRAAAAPAPAGPQNAEAVRDRLFALPERPRAAAGVGSELDALLGERVPGYETFKAAFSESFRFDPETMELRPLKVGSHLTGGSVIGRIGEAKAEPAHMNFAIRPAGRGAPTVDPKPILDGWKLLETTAIYRASGRDPFGADASVGQVLLMSKASLMQRVLADPRISIYECGRRDIETGQIDRRTLAMLEYLVAKGYRLTVTSLKCGHSYYTAGGSVSAHSYGAAVDIAAVNGIPILGNQGPGSITESVLRDLMALQGTMRPAQLISLMELGPPTFALGDHADHIHVGYTFAASGGLSQLGQILKPEQWDRLIDRLGEIPNPDVRGKPSDASLPGRRASEAHSGE